MRMDKLTSRLQQALADAQSLAIGRDNNMIEPAHVMTALLDQQGGSVAPLLAMLRGLGAAASLKAAFRLGPVKAKLVEINLVMGIVKIALIVLAMVFSASPLPFETVATEGFLLWWWAGVTVLYLVGSDFFHVVRLVAYLDLWRAFER